jgi:hypothetical protein
MSSSNKKLEKIFNKLNRDGKIKDNNKPSQIIKLVSKEYGNDLTSSETEYVGLLIHRYSLTINFKDNLEAWDDLDTIYDVFEENGLIDPEKSNFQDDKKYIKELYDEYKKEENEEELPDIKNLEIEEEELPDIGELKIKEEEEENDIDQEYKLIDKILQKIGITMWDSDDDYLDKNSHYPVIKGNINRKTLKKITDKNDIPNIDEFAFYMAVRGSKLLISYSNEDEDVETTDVLIKPSGDLLKLYNELKSINTNEEEKDENLRLSHYSVRILQEIVNRLGTKDEKEKFKVYKSKEKMIGFILLNFFDTQKQKTKYFEVLDQIEENETGRRNIESEYQELYNELSEYTEKELLDIIEVSSPKTGNKSKLKSADKQSLIYFIIENIGSNYVLPPPPEPKKQLCSIDDLECKNDQVCDLDKKECVDQKGVSVGKYKVVGSEASLQKLRDKLGIKTVKIPPGTNIKPGKPLPIKPSLPPLVEEKKQKYILDQETWLNNVYLPYQQKLDLGLDNKEIISSGGEQLTSFVSDEKRLPYDARELDEWSSSAEDWEKYKQKIGKSDEKKQKNESPASRFKQLKEIQGGEVPGASTVKLELDQLQTEIARCLGLVENPVI